MHIESSCNSFIRRIAEALEKECLAQAQFFVAHPPAANQSCKILVALSGGPDSTSLLLALAALKAVGFRLVQKNVEIEAGHMNHGLRGEDSDDDENFCRELCSKLNIPLRVEREIADVSGSASEESLREKRYTFLHSAALEAGAQLLVTAHTQDDQAETVLFRLIRGTSLAGSMGIPKGRQLSDDCLLLRPMLGLTRVEVVKYLEEERVQARHDRSNEQSKYSRNFIRNEVLNAINERFPGASARISRFSEILSADNDYMEVIADEHYRQFELDDDKWNIDALAPLHEAIRRRLLAMALKEREIALDFERICTLDNLLMNPIDTRISLNAQFDVERKSNHLWWRNKTIKPCLIDFEIELQPGKNTLIEAIGKIFQWEDLSTAENGNDLQFPPSQALEAIVDFENVQKNGLPLVLRRRRAGDFIQPFGRSEKVSLKKYLHTSKAASREENLRQVLEKDFAVGKCIVLAVGPEVLWIPGIGLSQVLKVGAGKRQKISILPAQAL